MALADRTCVACHGGTPPLVGTDAKRLLMELGPAWTIDDAGHLERTFKFRDFAGALRFANVAGEVAEAENHHPELHVGWGHVRVEIWTHAIQGLSESDFVLAAKIERAAGG